MRKQAFFVLAVVAAGCSVGPEGDGAAPVLTGGAATPQQVRAFAALNADTGRSWSWLQHPELKTPLHLSAERGGGEAVLTRDEAVVTSTLTFLGAHKELFRMRDPGAELRVEKTRVDALGMTHARFQQVTHGVRVVGAELMAHYDREGRITSIDANYVPDLDRVDLEPSFTAEALAEVARADAARGATGEGEVQTTTSDGELVVFALGGRAPRLAYEFSVRSIEAGIPAIWVTTVDAKTGEILDRYNDIQTIEATGRGVLGDIKKFEVSAAGGGFAMTDNSKGVTVRTHTAENRQLTAAEGAVLVSSPVLTTWDQDVAGPGAAVDAHVHASAVFDYYKAKFDRNSLNGRGGAMVSTAHFGNQFDNAFWDPQNMQMAYGDGGTVFRPLSAGLDVVAHEFTHGVITSESNLRYQGQPGAMNESVADIFGAFVEHEVSPDATKNWQIGEVIMRQGGVLRDMKNPAVGRQPAHMSRYVNTQQDNGGVHINSGIPNNAAFLMTVGGTNPVSNVEVAFGIGFEKAEQIWYRANKEYFMTTTNFAQAAQGVMEAAKDMKLTENEQNIVDCAFKAVGIVQGDCATLVDPQAKTPLPGDPDPDGEGDGTGSVGTSAGDDDESDGTSSTSKRSRSRVLGGPQSSGCSAAPQGGSDLAPLAGLFAAIFGLASARRRRRSR
jgi:bacillolysin